MKVKVVNNSINELPKYANLGDAGMDLRADFSKGLNKDLLFFSDFNEERNVLIIFSGGRALIPTNLHTRIPKGYEVQIRSRSGLALKSGVMILNSPGTIDEGFSAGWGLIVANFGDDPFEVAQGDRIAQAVLNKFETIEWDLVDSLDDTERGLGGFGSTGKQ